LISLLTEVDCEDTFDLCNKINIKPVIKIRKNACDDGLSPRAKEVRLYKSIGYKKWAKKNMCGMRWLLQRVFFPQ